MQACSVYLRWCLVIRESFHNGRFEWHTRHVETCAVLLITSISVLHNTLNCWVMPVGDLMSGIHSSSSWIIKELTDRENWHAHANFSIPFLLNFLSLEPIFYFLSNSWQHSLFQVVSKIYLQEYPKLVGLETFYIALRQLSNLTRSTNGNVLWNSATLHNRMRQISVGNTKIFVVPGEALVYSFSRYNK